MPKSCIRIEQSLSTNISIDITKKANFRIIPSVGSRNLNKKG